MSQALTEMIPPAEAQSSDSTKKHLDPADHRQDLAHDAVCSDHISSDPSMPAFFQVQSQVNAYEDLCQEEKHQPIRKAGVHILGELSAFMGVSKKIANNGEHRPKDLDGNMPTRVDDA